MRITNLLNSNFHKRHEFFLCKTLTNVLAILNKSYLAELPKVCKRSIHPELSRRVGISQNLKMVFIIINVIIIIVVIVNIISIIII